MRISIFGLGYVGAVSAGCLAQDGHVVVGVDTSSEKVALINQGKSPVIEKDLDRLISDAVKNDQLCATQDVTKAIRQTEISFICVGTPSESNGSLDLSYVERVCKEIGQAIAQKDAFHTVVARSTMLPGSMASTVVPVLERASGKKAGEDFGVCLNPEFLREGTAVYDFFNPPKTVIGESDTKAGDALAAIYGKLDSPLIRVNLESAEMVKYADNVWHALKVGFANEIGNICKQLDIDSHVVMNVFCQDTKLNLSPYYLKPGFAFGGSCLPKDVRALTYKAKAIDVEVPILNAILPSNKLQVERAITLVENQGSKRVGILGFSFKAGTDDLRESPVVELIERLLGKGYEISLYDRNVHAASLVGANKEFIQNKIPHISRLMLASIEEVVSSADVLVIGNNSAEFATLAEMIRDDQHIIDLVRILDDENKPDNYQGICW